MYRLFCIGSNFPAALSDFLRRMYDEGVLSIAHTAEGTKTPSNFDSNTITVIKYLPGDFFFFFVALKGLAASEVYKQMALLFIVDNRRLNSCSCSTCTVNVLQKMPSG